MGCSASRVGGAPRRKGRQEVPPELQAFVASAKERLARGEAAIPCQHTGALHGNWSGQCRGFCSLDAMRQYHDARMKEITEVKGDVLEHWQELDADFTLQRCCAAGSGLPPLRELRPRIRESMLRQAVAYREALWGLPQAELCRLKAFESLWPCAAAEELREAVTQPEQASSMRLTYAAAVARLELLYLFTFGLAQTVGESGKQVSWSVKRPLRMRRKVLEGFPEDLARGSFRRCTDVIRTSLTVGSLAQVEQLVPLLEGLGHEASSPAATLERLGLGGCRASFVVERIKNRFVSPCTGGYMDLAVSLRINGYVAELQVQLQRLAELRGDGGRSAYKWFRPFRRDRSEYAGERSADGHLQGEGTFCSLLGSRYRGDFKNGKRHGRGVFYLANGDRYEGEFVDGKKHGTGSYFYASGDCYSGGFVNDRMEGIGTYLYANGERFEGEYVKGKRHGKGVYHYLNGTTRCGDWWRNKYVIVVSV